MTTISIFNGKERDKRYAILLWHDVETGRDTIARLDETDAATLRDTLSAWLDAPRLAARATAEVVETRPARDGTGDAKLVRSVGFDEWAVISPSGNLYCGWGAMGDGERQARGVFNIVTTKEASK